MLENPASPSSNFSFPMTNSSQGRFSHVASPLNPSQKKTLKTSVHFPITITVVNTGQSF